MKKLMMRLMFGEDWVMVRKDSDGNVQALKRTVMGGRDLETREVVHHFTGRKAP